jgi:hypothetical protein
MVTQTQNGMSAINDNQRRLAARVEPVRGWYICPGWSDGRLCTDGPDGQPVRTRKAQPLGKHRADKHDYVSPAADYNKNRTKGQKKRGAPFYLTSNSTRFRPRKREAHQRCKRWLVSLPGA